jgi:hypothetical protein
MVSSGDNLNVPAAFQAEVAVSQIVPEIIHLAVLETAILIDQFGIVPVALVIISLTDKLGLFGMLGAK